MGRTLHYTIHCDEASLAAAWTEIRRMQDAMNRGLSWSCEALNLMPLCETPEVLRQALLRTAQPALAAWGFTKVRENDWNAMLVVRFCHWLSGRIPEAAVKLRDEGGLVLGGRVDFRGGAATLDAAVVDRGGPPGSAGADGATEYRSYLGASERHVFIRHVPAGEYADLPEIEALGLPAEELARLGVHEVSMRVRLPWERRRRTAKQP